MKIVACCRAYNEERHIQKFCEAYQFADEILVADGGSTDNTVAIAESIPKVKVIHYDVKVECKNGIWRNPDGPHIQFLIDHAKEDGATWIIFQDTDMRPNKRLKEKALNWFNLADEMGMNFLMLTQIFVWKDDQYFPDLSFQGGEWMQGLWAWRASIGLKIIDKMPHFEFSYDGVNSVDVGKEPKRSNIKPPSCYLHFGWESDEKVQEHINYYRSSGLIAGMAHPLDFAGKPKPLEDWMIE